MIARYRFLLSMLALFALLIPALAQASANVTSLVLTNSVRSGRTTFDYTYRIVVLNGPSALNSAQASVRSTAVSTQILKGNVVLGNLAAGSTTTSTDTFTIRQDRSVPFDPTSLVWTVSGVPVVGVLSMDLTVSEPFVAPDGIITVTPTIRDANGVVVNNAGFQFNLAVVPIGTVTGNSPVVSGLTVQFPKLTKRLLNQNTSIDPSGQFADSDPTDPNYGQETGGRYRVTVSVVGLSLSSSQEVMVLPSGTAQITFNANQYAEQLGNVLSTATLASTTGDTAMMDQARAALRTVDANGDFSFTVLSATNAMAPPDGSLLTPDLLAAQGFVAGPQDAQFATALADLVTRIRQAKAQVDTINTAALTQDSIDALQSATTAFKQSLQTLHGLQLSTLGTVQQQGAINQVLATEIPQLLDSIKHKSGDALGVTITSELSMPSVVAAVQPAPKKLSVSSPQTMYAGTQPVQVVAFSRYLFFTLWDLSGAARGNIIELTVTLINSLANIQAAKVINKNSLAELSLDYCFASSDLQYVCPNYIPTRIGGSGFGRDASAIRVAVVGCFSGELIKNLMTLRRPTSIAAGIRLGNKVISITQSLGQQGGVGAVVVPDRIGVDEVFGSDEDMLFFGSGWPRVNQGRLPCVGIVIVMNLQTGGLTAVNLQILGQCG